MSRTMTLPKIGVNMTEAIVDEWFVKPGDSVKEGDAIFLAETDKATQDIFATDSGIVGKLLAAPGDTIGVHQPIMILLDEGEEFAEDMAAEPPQVAKAAAPDKQPAVFIAKAQTVAPIADARVRISPLAKKMAKERGIEIGDLSPSEPGKRIAAADVLAYKPAVAPHSALLSIAAEDVLEAIPMNGVRKVIASRMTQSNLEKPSSALTVTARVDKLIALREQLGASGRKVSYNEILVRIAANVLCVHRNLNAVLSGDEILLRKNVNVGVAVDSERGLVVPVIRDADNKSLGEIATDLAQKVQAIKAGTIDAMDLSDGTFTITNLGMFEIEQFVPIINPPETCILAVGAMKKEFVPNETEQPVWATTMKMTLVFDHRIVDGAPAAKGLQLIKKYVECPELLL